MSRLGGTCELDIEQDWFKNVSTSSVRSRSSLRLENLPTAGIETEWRRRLDLLHHQVQQDDSSSALSIQVSTIYYSALSDVHSMRQPLYRHADMQRDALPPLFRSIIIVDSKNGEATEMKVALDEETQSVQNRASLLLRLSNEAFNLIHNFSPLNLSSTVRDCGIKDADLIVVDRGFPDLSDDIPLTDTDRSDTDDLPDILDQKGVNQHITGFAGGDGTGGNLLSHEEPESSHYPSVECGQSCQNDHGLKYSRKVSIIAFSPVFFINTAIAWTLRLEPLRK